MTRLPPAFLHRPLAHRALHGPGRPENSVEAVRAAIDAGYGIEVDLQLSADGEAMVFHDAVLDRLTGKAGPVAGRTAQELRQIPLTGSEAGIPTFAEVLALVAGRVPLLVEIKDQDGQMGGDVGPLEEAAARAADGYAGPLAFMSFNPHSVGLMAELAPGVARGLTTSAFREESWPGLPAELRARLREMPDFARVGASFISHEAADLSSAPVARVKAEGHPVLCWTIRSEAQATEARAIADNITFEGFAP
ncbi:glycerophosphodiester phosphodiesterase family protein [Pseudoroseicyclus tamaricis]|uniref:Phosphodiesterase n=1 Tax=Pseudoroseicyclus tamaricis TaxID=2705421 RepID=A0A6B2JMP9_9RHOB|nr:glycerophosphodiester phosphodiesterase family protein [Pseudoroseicyclus tamaricis]NDV02871.1 phosphodiesterase [Pseudoroseicyclus tamaricis]